MLMMLLWSFLFNYFQWLTSSFCLRATIQFLGRYSAEIKCLIIVILPKVELLLRFVNSDLC